MSLLTGTCFQPKAVTWSKLSSTLMEHLNLKEMFVQVHTVVIEQ